MSGTGPTQSDTSKDFHDQAEKKGATAAASRLNVVLSQPARAPAHLPYLGLLVVVDRVARSTAAATKFRVRDLTLAPISHFWPPPPVLSSFLSIISFCGISHASILIKLFVFSSTGACVLGINTLEANICLQSVEAIVYRMRPAYFKTLKRS